MSVRKLGKSIRKLGESVRKLGKSVMKLVKSVRKLGYEIKNCQLGKKAPNFDLGLLIKLGYYNGPKKTAL